MKKTIYIILFAFMAIGCAQTPNYSREAMPSYAMPASHSKEFKSDDSYFVYGGVQSMAGIPMGGVGVRFQKEAFFLDCSAYACLLYFPDAVSIFHLRSLFLFYPNQKGFYLGAGFGLLNEPETTGISGSAEAAVGFQWSEQFLELSAIAPFFTLVYPVWPGLTMGIGF